MFVMVREVCGSFFFKEMRCILMLKVNADALPVIVSFSPAKGTGFFSIVKK
jgi:hypothetical protein